MAALTGLSSCAAEMSHARGLWAAEAPLGCVSLWAGEPQDRCHQHMLSVSLLLLLFLGRLDAPWHPLLVAAPDVLWWSLPSYGSPCLQAFWQAGGWCWLPGRGGPSSEAWVSPRLRCASLMAVRVLWPLRQSLVGDTSSGDERAPQGGRWGTGQEAVQGEETPNR